MKSKIYQDTIRDLMKLSVPKDAPKPEGKGAHGVSITIHTEGKGGAPEPSDLIGAEDGDISDLESPEDAHKKSMAKLHAKK